MGLPRCVVLCHNGPEVDVVEFSMGSEKAGIHGGMVGSGAGCVGVAANVRAM